SAAVFADAPLCTCNNTKEEIESAMASNLAMMKDKLFSLFVVGVLVLVHAAFSHTAFAQGSADAAEAYEWSAELVAFDAGSGMATLTARMDRSEERRVGGDATAQRRG